MLFVEMQAEVRIAMMMDTLHIYRECKDRDSFRKKAVFFIV